MRTKTLVKLLSAGGLALATLSGPVYADPAQCQTVDFNSAVLARFPRIREVCQDVVNREGQDYAVVKGKLVRIGLDNKQAHIKPILPDGTEADTMAIAMHPDRKVTVDGASVLPADLAVGQTLTFFVKVTEPVAVIAPADEAPVAAMPYPEVADVTQDVAPPPPLPKTASPLPALGLGGLLLLALGGGIRRVRARQK